MDSSIIYFLAPLVGLASRVGKMIHRIIFFSSFSSPTIIKYKRKRSSFYELLFLLAPLVGLEPTTYRLTAERSTN